MPKPKQVLKNKIEIDPVEFSNKLSNFLDGVREKFGDDYIKKIRSFLYLRSRSAYLYILCVVILLSVLVFFGYKLYISLTERERKKEEKRRQKQQKKRK